MASLLGRLSMHRSFLRSLVLILFPCAASIAALPSVGPAAAAGAPAAALNKTVTLSWSTSGSGRRADGAPVSFSNVNTRVIYISSAGRPFLRMQLSGKKASRQGELGPGEKTRRGGNVSLQGNRLVGIEAFASGARQYIATFDASFSSCSLSVIDAKAGAAKIKRRGPDESMFELDNVSTGSPSCSIQSGNAFAR
jgi:hypothetical protein